MNISEIFLIAIILSIFLYETYAILFNKELLTSVIWRWLINFPVFGVFIGIIIGHLFWPHGYWIKKENKEQDDEEGQKESA